MFVATRLEGAVSALNNDRIHRQVLMPVYLPALLLAVPGQAVWILLPLYVLELGGSPAAAATVVGLRGVGMMAADIPAGMLAARFGDRSVMICSIVLMGAAYLGFALVERVQPLYAIAFVYGTGASSYLLGRMSYITDACAAAQRGRVIAMVAGSMRASALVGPLAGGALAEFAGFKVAFLGGGACVFLGLLCVTVFAHRARPAGAAPQVRAVVRLALEHRRVFATAGHRRHRVHVDALSANALDAPARRASRLGRRVNRPGHVARRSGRHAHVLSRRGHHGQARATRDGGTKLDLVRSCRRFDVTGAGIRLVARRRGSGRSGQRLVDRDHHDARNRSRTARAAGRVSRSVAFC